MNLALKQVIAACVFSFCIGHATAGIGGKTRDTAEKHPVLKIPKRPHLQVFNVPRPGKNYFWRPGEWVWRNGTYEWSLPGWEYRVKDRHWRPGHWRRTQEGYVWKPGKWVAFL